MNKADFIKAMQENGGFASIKETNAAYDAFWATVLDALKDGEKIQLAGAGTFEVKERKARECINPKTGEKIKVAESKAPSFKFGASFKAML